MAALSLVLISQQALHAQTPIQITEFPVGGNPIPLALGSDGNFWTWFSGTFSVGRITPAGVATAFSTPVGFPGATPGHCVDGRDGGIWCASFGQIVRVSESDGTASAFVLPPSSASDLTLGPDGALWFTDPSTNQIGRLTLSGVVTEIRSLLPSIRGRSPSVLTAPFGSPGSPAQWDVWTGRDPASSPLRCRRPPSRLAPSRPGPTAGSGSASSA